MGAGRRYAPDNNDLTSPWRNPSPRPLFVQPHVLHLHRLAWPNFATKTEPPCTAMRRFEPARTPYPHRPMIPTSSPRPGRGCAEDLLKRRNTRVAVAFRHRRNLGRMIGHAQRPRYVAIVLLSFFLTPIVSALPPRYFGPRPSLLTVDFTPSSTPSFYTFTIQAFLVHFPHFRAGTTLTFTFVIPPAPTRPSVTLQQLSSAHHHH
jgi:hypothetical protein